MLLDLEYISRLSPELKKFRKTGNNCYNFRCPICGDSAKDENKARAWFTKAAKTDKMAFKCWNCGEAMFFHSFLKKLFPELYKEYLLDKFKASRSSTKKQEYKNENMKEFKLNLERQEPSESYFSKLHNITSLSVKHPARQYIMNRWIPVRFFGDLFWTDSFKAFTNSILPNKFESLENDHGRIIIPLRDEFGQDFGFQARAINPHHKPKYYTIIVRDIGTRAYGLDKIDISKPILVVEGPFDSMFFDNCVAACGSDLSKVVGDAYMLDNEPRNEHIVKKYKRLIEDGKKVVILPHKYIGLDINDMVIKGIPYEVIEHEVRINMVSGAKALLKLNQWKKV